MPETFDLQVLLRESADQNNPDADGMKRLLDSVKTIAVVGISRNAAKPARKVPAYLAANGYDIIPVNPFVDEIFGKKAADSLDEVTQPVDMVLVFRPSAEAADVAESALARAEQPAIWFQKEIQADEVAARARGQGVTMVQDLCAYEIHKAIHPG